jgi:PAS domain S-box-containing protein
MKRILIVDDNQDLTATLVRVLEDAEHLAARVVTAERGDQAVEIAKRDGFDVALVDVRLPDVSGVELIARLRKESPTSEVVLITGATTVDTALSALRSGAFAFVLKSFRPEELLATVEQALAKVMLVREREDLERRYRDLVELADVVVVGLDESLRVVFFNSKASQLTGISPKSALSRPFLHSWISPADQQSVRDTVEATRADGQPRDLEVTFQVPVVRRIRWHLSRAGSIVYGIGLDVTERTELERRTRENEALAAMGELAMNLAHEIRNPLNAAVLQLHLLGKQVARLAIEAPTRDALLARAATVGSEIGRLNRMLTEFLELSRPRMAQKEQLGLDTLVDEVLSLEADSAAERNVIIARDFEPVQVSGDASKLKQVLLNVVVNAFEAMREGGTLTVRTYRDAEEAVVAFGDTGPGIADKDLAQVFAPFFTTKAAGTGLGLSIVRKIVDQHGGRAVIESVAGEGTTVSIRLPLVAGAHAKLP